MGKYLFLYLKTGGGHMAPAKAVAEKIRIRKRLGFEVDSKIILIMGGGMECHTGKKYTGK